MFSKIFKLGKSKKEKKQEKSQSYSPMVNSGLGIDSQSMGKDRRFQKQLIPKKKDQECEEDNRHGKIVFIEEKQVQIQESSNSSGSSKRREQKKQQQSDFSSSSQSSQSSLEGIKQVGQKLDKLFKLFEAILLKQIQTLNPITQYDEYNYQQVYEKVYKIVNSQKTEYFEEFQTQKRLDSFMDLILYNLFYVLVQKKVFLKIQKRIKQTFQSHHFTLQNKYQQRFLFQEQIKRSRKQYEVNRQLDIMDCIRQLVQIMKRMRSNIQEVGSILLYMETQTNEQNRFLRFDNKNTLQKQDKDQYDEYDVEKKKYQIESKNDFEWKYSCCFSVTETIYDIIINKLLTNQIYLSKQQERLNKQQQQMQRINYVTLTFQLAFTQLNYLFIKSKTDQSDQENKNPIQNTNKSFTQLKSILIQFTQLFIKSTYKSYLQKSSSLNNIHNILYLLISKNSPKNNIISLYKNYFNSLITQIKSQQYKEKLQSQSQKKQQQIKKEQQIINPKIFDFLSKAKHTLDFIKSILRQLFLQPQLQSYKQILYKNNRSDLTYLRYRNCTKISINHFISQIFASSIFTVQNITFILQNAVSCNNCHVKKSEGISINNQQLLSQKIENELFAFFIGEKLNNQNFFLSHKQFEVNKTITQQQMIISFQPFIESGSRFFQKYKQVIFDRVVQNLRYRFKEKIGILEIQSVNKANKLIDDFLTVYRKLKNYFNNNQDGQKDAIHWIINMNSLKLSSLINVLSQILDRQETNFEMRLIVYTNQLQSKDYQLQSKDYQIQSKSYKSEQKQQKQKKKINKQLRQAYKMIVMSFLQMFKLGCKNQSFRDNFQLLLSKMFLYQALTQINCQSSCTQNQFTVNKEIVKQISVSIQSKALLGIQQQLYNWQYVNILPQDLLSQLLLTQGSQYLNRILQIINSIKNMKILYCHPFKYASLFNKPTSLLNKSYPHLKNTTQSLPNKAQQIRLQNIQKYHHKLISHSKSNQDLSKMNVILLDQNLFLSKHQVSPFTYSNLQQIILYKSPLRSQFLQTNPTQYPTQFNLNSPNIVFFDKIDPILTKFIKQYEERFYFLLLKQNQSKKDRQFYWVLSSFLETNVILSLKIPLKNHHQHQATQNNTIHQQKNSQMSNGHKTKSISFRMPLIMADIFLFSIRRRIYQPQNYIFTVQQYLMEALQNLKLQTLSSSNQLLELSQKIIKYTRRMVQSGFLEIIHPQEQNNVNYKTEIKISQMLYKWRTKKQHDFVKKLVQNNASHVNYQKYGNQTVKINLIDFMQKFNQKFSQNDLNQNQPKIPKEQDEIQKQLLHPSTQFLFLFQCFMVKFFKKIQKIKANQLEAQLFRFIMQHYENKKQRKLNLVQKTMIFYSRIFFENQKQTMNLNQKEAMNLVIQKVNYQKGKHLLVQYLKKLIKKQYILIKSTQENQQISNIQISKDFNSILEKHQVYFQYNP